MKALSFIILCSVILLGIVGCNLPRHFAKEEVNIYYYDIDYVYIEPVGGPHPLPNPPYTPITRPDINGPTSRQPLKPDDNGNSYNKRDPLQGGNHRGSGEIKSDPPVRKPPQKNDRVR